MKSIIFAITVLLLLTACDLDISGSTITDFDAPQETTKTAPKEKAPEEPVKLCTPNITIASFNLKDFSNKSRTDEELELVTDVLSNFDLIAVQEVTGDPVILTRTVDMLNNKTGRQYIFEVSAPLGNVQKERYAFIFDRNKVDIFDGPIVYSDIENKFIREPYYALFQADNFDFMLMTVHIVYGEGPADRTEEMEEIAAVYNYLQRRDPVENDVILTGDFNTQPWEDNFQPIKDIKDSWYLISKGKTTLGSSGNLYDNIIFTKTPTQEYTGAKGIYMFDEIMDLKSDEAKLAVSDHRPIYAVFCTGQDDD